MILLLYIKIFFMLYYYKNNSFERSMSKIFIISFVSTITLYLKLKNAFFVLILLAYTSLVL